MFHELHGVALGAGVVFGLLGFWLRWMSPLGGAILLGGLAAICVGLWWWLRGQGGGLDVAGHAFLLGWVLAPGLGGAVLGVALAWWLGRS